MRFGVSILANKPPKVAPEPDQRASAVNDVAQSREFAESKVVPREVCPKALASLRQVNEDPSRQGARVFACKLRRLGHDGATEF
jgi:hypothetical protein